MRAVLHAVLLAASLGPALAAWRVYNNSNDVLGCPMTCVNSTPPYLCLGTVPSATGCQAAAAAGGHALFSFSSHTSHCWTRADGTWAPTGDPGVASGCDDAEVAHCAPPPPPPPTANVTVAVGTAPVARTHALHPAVALDFWRRDDSRFGEKWGNSSALTIDLSSAALKAAATALAGAATPTLLRLGGSPEDSLIFDSPPGSCVPQSGGRGPFPGYFCSQVQPYSYDCLTQDRWAALLDFAAATGLQIAFGLNGCWGRPSEDTPMDYTNAEAFISATAALPAARTGFFGFELSNEVVPNTVAPAAWAADAAHLKAFAATAFSAAGLPPPPMVGPDQGCCAAQEGVVAAGFNGNALTYHEYPECEAADAAGFALMPSCLLAIDSHAAAVTAIAAKGRDGPLAAWMGEGADHSGGGVPGLTDTFRSSFYTASLYGASAAAGVELTARQCLSGGDYELLQRDGFAPNPDFWVVWLFKSLMGGGVDVFNVTSSAPASSGVRVFAFAAATGTGATTALLAVNLQLTSSVSVTLSGAPGAAARTEFHLTGDLDVPHGTVSCNGAPLAFEATTLAPPPWRSLGAPAAAGSPLVLAPASIAFALV
jgi:hypothetical protein